MLEAPVGLSGRSGGSNQRLESCRRSRFPGELACPSRPFLGQARAQFFIAGDTLERLANGGGIIRIEQQRCVAGNAGDWLDCRARRRESSSESLQHWDSKAFKE